MAAINSNGELFSTLVSNIKTYSGSDPLRPWLQGIRKMKESLPSHVLKEKLPRFLQKCAQTFESDRRYRNDSRYIRVWIQLMDYVEDARVILRKMEKNHIGLKRAMFYSAYALYYEKQKKFEEAESMYCLGVQNLAEPADELQKSYEQFLHRMKLLKERKTKKLNTSGSNRHPSQQAESTTTENGDASQISRSIVKSGDQHGSAKPISPITGFSKDGGGQRSATSSSDMKLNANTDPNEASDKCDPNLSNDGFGPKIADRPTLHCSDDTVVVKFVGSAIVGKSEAEDACHHGLVDPTVNMMEAMNAISSMFREPLEVEPAAIRRSKPKENPESNNILEVFVDECLLHEKQTETKLMNTNSPRKQTETEPQKKPLIGAFKIWTEEDGDDEEENDDLELNEHLQLPKPVYSSLNSSCSAETDVTSSEDFRVKGDTVIRRFVGLTVFDDPEVENACHHGLVDPTVNLKEAMDDINSMFGKPLNFVRAKRPMKQAKPIEHESASQGFCILADDDLGDDSCGQASQANPSKFGRENDLFEPTVFTKEAMADINELFGKPLDF